MFNLIHATKTKNTMILEPLASRHQKNDSMRSKQAENPTDFAAREEVGSGLKAEEIGGLMS